MKAVSANQYEVIKVGRIWAVKKAKPAKVVLFTRTKKEAEKAATDLSKGTGREAV
jgi:shikimate 5-dehydrogenase